MLEEMVEHVPKASSGLRWRAEAGAALIEALTDAGHPDAADGARTAYPLTDSDDPRDPDRRLDPVADDLALCLVGSVPDGEAALAALRSGVPEWIASAADPAGAEIAAREWLAWADGPPDRGGCWTTSRLEHRFLLRFGHGDTAAVVAATGFGGGSARWHHLTWLPEAMVALDGDDELDEPAERTDVLLATPLRYPGQPADRYWQLEDGAVDIAAIEAQPHDLARLCLAEFALNSGDDWLIVPVDGRAGALNQVRSVVVRNSFGEETSIGDASAARRGRGFRIFEVTAEDGRELDGVVLAPTGPTPLVGDPIEEVALLRDEVANLAWAVETVVPGRSGDGRRRDGESPSRRPRTPDDIEPGDLWYELAGTVPAHWIPLVPVRLAPGQVALRKGAMLDAAGEPVHPAGELLTPTPLTFPMEEIPREGVTVRTVPVLSRRRNGSYARWTGHRVNVGRGEGASAFVSDAAHLPPAAR
ncbi:hypothetical protein [Mobilicoccus massiliensis]|uniref:hypothetical protein n=1 Tax=Mobilicoccus massiliensis TaxID=1522310 RepID=UPI001143EDF8|nr:hypothetical protein [Mobilicoccus massiliensis]